MDLHVDPLFFLNNLLTKRNYELMIFVRCQEYLQGALEGN
jgi:hypothetical protein